MNQKNNPIEARDRSALRDYIGNSAESLRSGSEVEDIIMLAIASASRVLRATSCKAEVTLVGGGVRATPAFEQRIVALFGD